MTHSGMTPPDYDAREAVLNARFQYWSTLAAISVTTIGTAVLVGWSLRIDALIQVSTGWPAMNPVTAMALVMCGFSLALLRESRLTPERRLTAQLLALVVVLLGITKVADALTGNTLRMDHMLFDDAIHMRARGAPSGMALNTATNFVLFGLALIYFAGVTKLSHRLSQACSTIATIIAVPSLIAYLYAADMAAGAAAKIPMAVHTAASFVILGTGLLIAPGTQAIKLVSRADQGGKMVRQFFPATVLILLVLGYLRIEGEDAGWYGTAMGTALHVAVTIVALAGLLWWNATMISSADRQRLAVEAELQTSEAALRAANEALATQVRTDSLTGICNRMSLDEELDRAMKNLHRYESEIFSLLMIDVDYFKRYNDSFGHLAGDDVLRGVARLLKSTCRETDIIGRYGGEEFVVILTHAGAHAARETAERIRRKIEQHEWPEGIVTVTVGVATASQAAINGDEILHEADVALYLAKEAGRNRVRHSMDPVTAPAA